MDKIKTVIRNDLSEYINKIKSVKRSRLIVSVGIAILLSAVTMLLLRGGSGKRLILSAFMCLATGVLIYIPNFKKLYTVIPLIILYLLYVPKKLFERMELPIHDMSGIQPGILLLTIMIIIFFYAIVMLVSRRTGVALGVGGIILLFIFLTNYYVVQFRGASFGPNDVLAIGTAMSVVKGYSFTVSAEQWYSILYFIFFIVLGFKCDIKFSGVAGNCIAAGAAAAYIIGFILFFKSSWYFDRYSLQGYYWNMHDNELLNGFLCSFGISLKELKIDKPDGYSDAAISEIIEHVTYDDNNRKHADVKPNIIMIMNEAWSDVGVLGNLETSEPYMPFTDSLADKYLKGNLHVNILGGLTANTEFEALTADALAFLPASAIPYQLQVNHDISSLPRILEAQGYQTLAMHPSGSNAWNRENAYRYMGFSDFDDANEFGVEIEKIRDYISDECNYKEIIYQFERKEAGKPFFLFDVTIQNHSPFYGGVEMPIVAEVVGNTDVTPEEIYSYDLDTYLNLIKISDDAFKDLVSYFEKVEEPTIICMFGDHQPLLYETSYNAFFESRDLSEAEIEELKHITPYVIWSNYDIEYRDAEDISANYLGAVLLEYAGVEMPEYYKFLLELKKQYPVITLRNIEQLETEEAVNNYRILQYNQLMESDYREDVFLIK